MTDLPAPLVPADVDLTGFDGFMLDVQRLFASELWAISTGDEFKAALGLWGRAWQQKPPGSLPNDERVLAAFSGAGRNWKKVRAMALRGFVECSDGRLYHRVLCGDVLSAHAKRQAFKERTKQATEARKKRDGGGGPGAGTGSEDCNDHRHDDRNDAATTERNGQRDVDRDVDVSSERNVATGGLVTSVQGQGQGQKDSSESQQPYDPGGSGSAADLARTKRIEPHDDGPDDDLKRTKDACFQALGGLDCPGAASLATAGFAPIMLLIEQGFRLSQITTVLRAEAAKSRAKPIRTWDLWAKIITEQLAGQPKLAPGATHDPTIRIFGMDVPERNVQSAVDRWHNGQGWHEPFGPPPDDPRCVLPERFRQPEAVS